MTRKHAWWTFHNIKAYYSAGNWNWSKEISLCCASDQGIKLFNTGKQPNQKKWDGYIGAEFSHCNSTSHKKICLLWQYLNNHVPQLKTRKQHPCNLNITFAQDTTHWNLLSHQNWAYSECVDRLPKWRDEKRCDQTRRCHNHLEV